MSPAYPRRSGDDILFPRCTDCGRWRWPDGEICRTCGSDKLVATPWSGTAVLLAEVRVHRGVPAPFLADGPYDLIALDLGGLRFLTRWASRPATPIRGQACTLRWGEIHGTPWPLAHAQTTFVTSPRRRVLP
ncbi:Zn-ribbon domain-containing OB-fold protein [Amycolatopsis magusensis]|uniref:OB-fold protein n=1 Tax=Amycolatopsis magusensis TaxID=882444 RepID=A0ABS4PYF8_9PSEU|nr:putative OB-fold protein [Amycolatopsis magusensis]